MTDKKTFKGFSLNSSGDVLGAFPTVDIIQERAKDLMNEVTGNINQMTIDYCLKFNIDPDVLIKQKAEIELLQMKNKELEKENAELKETLRTYNGCGDWDNDFHTCRVYLQHEELQMYTAQLTKAKEIIKGSIILLTKSRTALDTKTYLMKAEQFLNSENIILEDAQAGNGPFDADEVFNKEMKAYPEEK